MATISWKGSESHLCCPFFSFCRNTLSEICPSPPKKTSKKTGVRGSELEGGRRRLRLVQEWIANHLKSSHNVLKPEGSSIFLYDRTTSEMYCKIIRSKQAGKMSDVLHFISWTSLVPISLQAAAVSVEGVEVEINAICVFFPHGFTQPSDMMDSHICCRKETECYTLLWIFGFPLFLFPSLRGKAVCAE